MWYYSGWQGWKKRTGPNGPEYALGGVGGELAALIRRQTAQSFRLTIFTRVGKMNWSDIPTVSEAKYLGARLCKPDPPEEEEVV